MANDTPSLSEEQTSSVAHLQEIVGCSTEEAVERLQRANWSLETAVNHFFNPNAVPNPSPPAAILNDSTDNSDDSFPRLRPNRQSVAPSYADVASGNQGVNNRAVVAQPQDSGIWRILNPLSEIVFLPFRYAFSLIGTIVRILSTFWSRPALSSGINRVVDATGDVEDFISSMHQKYGSEVMPQFYHGAYAAALREAQRELQFLLVYIHADENPSADAFCRKVLSDSRFKEFLTTNQVILWGCNVSRGEGTRVAHTIRAVQYPVLALISLKQGSMTIVLRISGGRMADATEQIINSLSRAVTIESANLTQERERRRQQAAQQELLREQDRRYHETLRQDQERQRAKAEREAAEAAALRAAEEASRSLTAARTELYDQIKDRIASIAAEPSADNTEAVQLVVRLPSGGSQLRRRFLLSETVATIYEWAHAGYWANSSNLHVLQLVISYPKQELPLPRLFTPLLKDPSSAVFEISVEGVTLSSNSSLRDVGITKSQALLAVVIEDEEGQN